MKNTIKIRLKREDKLIKVKLLIKHPMETGLRKNKKSGKAIPAHYIQELTCHHNGKVVMDVVWGVAVSKNPYMSFYVEDGKAGDVISIGWLDNLGHSDLTQKKSS